MADQYPNGGYAFPEGEMQHQTPNGWQRQLGMTLRDWFAGQVISGLYAGSGGPVQTTLIEVDAELAYEIADAMLAARAKGGE